MGMPRDGGRLPGGQIVRRLASDVRSAELPDARLWILYPLVGAVVAALVIFHAASGSHHPGSATNGSTPPASTTTPATQQPNKQTNSVDLSTEQGGTLAVPRAAFDAVLTGLGTTASANSNVVIVTHSTPLRSFTCVVTLITSNGQSVQRVVGVLEHAGGSWTTTGG